MGSLQEGDKQEKHTKAHNDTTDPQRSEERFSRNAETELVCRLLLEKKNPALTSALIARATSSRGSRSGVRRLFVLSTYQRSAPASVSAVSALKYSGTYRNMKRSPWLFLSVPPSPRTPSVTRMPRPEGGQTMPGGWN